MLNNESARLVRITSLHCSRDILAQDRVARDAGVVDDQHTESGRIAFHIARRGSAGVEIADVRCYASKASFQRNAMALRHSLPW